ncbi:hypothetical protein LMG18091_03250 [Ralstonia wenshanensis]|uniref:Uncharacterized protein n=1 Tax=Ralstonia wenshanensis TaxID=2842456 RepID=A0AAD2B439_9RALS|nr:hypothetical protein LMG18091_03250 [Ralstonia wenshanensis]
MPVSDSSYSTLGGEAGRRSVAVQRAACELSAPGCEFSVSRSAPFYSDGEPFAE